MALSTVNKLNKVLAQLAGLVDSTTSQTPRRNNSYEKEKDLVKQIRRHVLALDYGRTCAEFPTVNVAGIVSRVFHILLIFIAHTDESLRNLAYEVFATISRHLLIGSQSARLISIYLTQLRNGGSAKSVVALLSSLAKTIHYSKPKKIPILYAPCILTVLQSLVVRPEEAIHLALNSHLQAIFDVIGPYCRTARTNKPEMLVLVQVIFDKCLDVKGTPNRTASLLVSLMCTYSSPCLKYVIETCAQSLNERDDMEKKIRLMGTINILKAVWKLAIEHGGFTEKLQVMYCQVLSCMYSSENEIVIASLECVDRMLSFPLADLSFSPPSTSIWRSSPSSSQSPSNNAITSATSSPMIGRKMMSLASQQSSPMSSVLDLTLSARGDDTISVDNMTLASEQLQSEQCISSSEDESERIIDPLLHADLYEEQCQPSPEPPQSRDSPKQKSSEILDQLPDIFADRSVCSVEYTCAFVARRFLLGDPIGIKSDMDVRVSHKILAMNVLSSAASLSPSIALLDVCTGTGRQSLSEVVRLVYHEDDPLCAAAITFAFAAESSHGKPIDGLVKYAYVRVAPVPNAKRRRALINTAIGRQRVLERNNLLEEMIRLALTSTTMNFNLLKISIAQFFASIRWSEVSEECKRMYQTRCLEAMVEILCERDESIANAAAAELPKFVRNAEFGIRTNLFKINLPHSMCCPSYTSIPPVIEMSDGYSLHDHPVDFTVEENLDVVLPKLFRSLTRLWKSRSTSTFGFDQTTALIVGLYELTRAFPPVVYRHSWMTGSRVSGGDTSSSNGIVTILTDLCETISLPPTIYAKAIRVHSLLVAATYEHLLLEKAEESSPSTTPSVPFPLLFERTFNLSMRILNLYYAMMTERSTAINAKQSLLFSSTPNIIKTKKDTVEASKQHSRVQTVHAFSVSPKKIVFHESANLNRMLPLLKGAYRNYTNSLGVEYERKFCDLLEAAFEQLGTVVEMAQFQTIRPFMEEIVKYLITTLEVCPRACCRMMVQLIKLVFGRQSSAIDLRFLKSIKVQDPFPPKTFYDIFVEQSVNEFTLFSAFLGRAEFMQMQLVKHFGWLTANSFNASYKANDRDLSTALQMFEELSTKCISLYVNTTDIETKKVLLSLMIEYRNGKIAYNLADPRGYVINEVTEQLKHFSYPSMLTEVMCFMVVLERTQIITWEIIKEYVKVCLSHLDSPENVNYVLNALSVYLFQLLIVKGIDVDQEIPNIVFTTRFPLFFRLLPHKYLELWTIHLYASRKNDEQQTTVSRQLVARLIEFFNSNESVPCIKETLYSLMVTLNNVSPNVFRPITSFVELFKTIDSGKTEMKLIKLSSILSCMFGLIAEDRLLVRMEELIPTAPVFIVNTIYSVLWPATVELASDCGEKYREGREDIEEGVVVALQVLITSIRGKRIPKMTAAMSSIFTVDVDVIAGLLHEYPRVVSYWLSFLHLLNGDKLGQLAARCASHRNVRRLGLLYCYDYVATSGQVLPSMAFMFKSADHAFEMLDIIERKSIAGLVRILPEDLMEQFLDNCIDKQQIDFNAGVALSLFHQVEEFTRTYGRVPCPEKTAPFKALVTMALDIGEENEEPELPSLSECESFRDMFRTMVTSPQIYGTTLPVECMLLVPTHDIFYIFESLPPAFRRPFIAAAITAIERDSAEKSLENNGTAKKGEELLEVLKDLVLHDVDLVIFLLSKVNLLALKNIDMTAVEELVQLRERIFERATVLLKTQSNIEETCDALLFFLSHPLTTIVLKKTPTEYFPYIKDLLSAVISIVEKHVLEKMILKDNWDFNIVNLSSDSDLYRGICEVFDGVQYLAMVYQRCLMPENMMHVRQLVRTILRLPILNPLALTPRTAIDMNWRPVLELRNGDLNVSLVNIHLLSNVDVLRDFTWRIGFTGWTSRQQFENLWMSLSGVLSSTPSGSEMINDNARDQVLVSTHTVKKLTKMLLQTLMYPQPGNPITGTFIVKHRENSSLFAKSQAVNQLSILKARMTEDRGPSTVYKRNIERIFNNEEKQYGMSQLSAYALWSMIGLLGSERTMSTPDSPHMRSLTSNYLIQMTIELDTGSSVRALYENYTHWFSRGIDYIPIDLMCATVRSIALLSDLFEDPTSFVTLYRDMKMIFNSQYLIEHYDIGTVIYCLFKAVAVVGLEIENDLSEVNMCKQMQSWAKCGLTHKTTTARILTLHACMYILQSISTDKLRTLVKDVMDFIYLELQSIVSITDPIKIAGEIGCIDYETMVWTVAFRLVEEPQFSIAKGQIVDIMEKTFLRLNVPDWHMEVLTTGMESLCIHSTQFASRFGNLAKACFDEYSVLSSKFAYALRLFITFIYREELDPTRSSFKIFEPFIEALFNVLRLCDVGDAQLIRQVTTPILRRIYKDEKVLKILLKLLLPPNGKNNIVLPFTKVIVEMIFDLFEGLREKQRIYVIVDLTNILVNKLIKYNYFDEPLLWVGTLLLLATSTEHEAICRYHMLLEVPRDSYDWRSVLEWTKKRMRSSLQGVAHADQLDVFLNERATE